MHAKASPSSVTRLVFLMSISIRSDMIDQVTKKDLALFHGMARQANRSFELHVLKAGLPSKSFPAFFVLGCQSALLT